MKKPVILASQSSARQALLRQAGVPFEAVAARIDEAAVTASLQSEGATPEDIADALAEYKAARVAVNHADRLVIGSDQILVCDKALVDKAEDLDGVRDTLRRLRGKPHQLISAAVIFEDGAPVWRVIGRAQLFMRDFSDDFLDEYVARHGEDLCASIGCYFLEDDGVNLFTRIQGDYFSVLGFPLLDVLGFLRTRGVGET